MVPVVTDYIQSLSHQDAVTTSLILMNILGILGISTILYCMWEVYESWKEKRTAVNTEEEDKDKNTEHILYEYGTKECAIEIHHYAKPTLAEFLRHLRALSWEIPMTLQEFDEITSNLVAHMKQQNHPNTADVQAAAYMILNESEFPEVNFARDWLHIARTYWLMYPQNPMIPLEIDFGAEEKENRSMSF
jgi:hypothetical protein